MTLVQVRHIGSVTEDGDECILKYCQWLPIVVVVIVGRNHFIYLFSNC